MLGVVYRYVEKDCFCIMWYRNMGYILEGNKNVFVINDFLEIYGFY